MQPTTIIVIGVAILLFLLARGEANDVPAKLSDFNDSIEKASTRYGIPSNLIRAIMLQESSGRPNIEVDEGRYVEVYKTNIRLISYGLMGVTIPAAIDVGYRGTFKEAAVDLLKPDVNINYGTAYLRWLQKVNIPRLYGEVENAWTEVNGVNMPLDLMLAIISYNTGSGNIHRDPVKLWGWTKAGEDYLQRVTKRWAKLEG